ncbi:MAG: ABC transporter permease [Clostridia bacterium]|nr:ABC transporter permease [Clostridia bacterium]
MRTYLSFFRMRFLNGLQYRVAAVSGLVTQFFWGIMFIFICEAFYKSGGTPSTIAWNDLVTFIWLQQAFLALIMLYDWDFELFEMVTKGNISYEMCRPVDIYKLWYVKLFSKRLARATLRFSPIIIIASILPMQYRISLPQSPSSFMLFLVSLTLGLILLVAISMLIYISIFKTMSPVGSMAFFGLMGEFFGGMTIPIPLMPLWLQKVCYALPFRWCADLPLRVYSGNIPINEALTGVLVQLGWIVLLVGFGSFAMKKCIRLALVQGG